MIYNIIIIGSGLSALSFANSYLEKKKQINIISPDFKNEIFKNQNESLDLFDKIPDDFVKISESGISNARSVVRLIEAGFQGFLIGENFMKTEDPGLACKGFIDEVDSLLKITRGTV